MLQEKTLDKNVPIPLYFQLEKLILEEIEGGSYPVGSMIPTEKELSQMFDISRTTVRQAITDLVQKEQLYRIKSKGTFVSRPKISQEFIQSILSFNEDVMHAGRTPSTEVLALKAVQLPQEIAVQMNLAADTRAIYLYRKRYADADPIVRVETYLPYDSCSFLLDHDFTHESLYDVLSTQDGTKITRIKRLCEARPANSEDVAVLGIKRGRPIQYFNSFGYNRYGKLMEFSIARYRGDQSKFQVEISRE
ncbi:conserved hypothetical protein [uncultured Eubacteriales bacterium]|uniref:HTH gntR-type domain-containing protein n=1 Tax=uncultured Eubacteriales bacterium TaxID=172733 RepID=A0A212KE76_9FIRM|nr:conserved hypothetical protein [uncultured Eubacteriales bacterium]